MHLVLRILLLSLKSRYNEFRISPGAVVQRVARLHRAVVRVAEHLMWLKIHLISQFLADFQENAYFGFENFTN